MTGPLYERPMTPLPHADETHTVPSGYWKIILVQLDDNSLNSIRAASYIFEQETPRSDSLMTHLTTINEIETRSGLDFLRELPNTLEQNIQADRFVAWAEQHFND